MRIGFMGLGNMGGPMAENLLRAGHELVVYNRTRSRAEALEEEGATVAESPAALTRDVDLVLSCLADIPATLELFLGEDGAIGAARAGQVLVDHGTVDLGTSRRLYAAARERQASFLDAPISGGPGGARDATLSIMVGGDPDAFETARPAFESMGKTVVHMGESGAGTATKLANQLLVGVHSLASCEALTLAREAGVDLEKLLRVLSNSWGASRMLERNAPYIRKREYGPSAAPLRNMVKDLSIITALGDELGLSLPSAREAEEAYRKLSEEGKSLWDITAACLLLKDSAAN